MEETFQAGKGLAGLDEHQLRRFTSWSRWVTLAMLAHAPLVRLATSPPGPSPGQPLPEASRGSHMKITLYGWSTRLESQRTRGTQKLRLSFPLPRYQLLPSLGRYQILTR
jgi:hypothetical protein